ncbi:MAG: tetratricopeptide repeat protein [Erythrobacter sp.]|uniref:tetratricopeptide repeat protein n=1 Tax=Erythrobacter sp. TaxID=1042 RepID=UPI003A8C7F09
MIKAARAGDNRAYVPVAKYYMDGTGVPADPTKGLFWLRKAEQRRDPEAYRLLAQAYLNGNGVRQNVQTAYSLVETARAAGANRQALEIERMVQHRVGDDTLTCMKYGMAYGTPQNGQCRLQLEQAKQQARNRPTAAGIRAAALPTRTGCLSGAGKSA